MPTAKSAPIISRQEPWKRESIFASIISIQESNTLQSHLHFNGVNSGCPAASLSTLRQSNASDLSIGGEQGKISGELNRKGKMVSEKVVNPILSAYPNMQGHAVSNFNCEIFRD